MPAELHLPTFALALLLTALTFTLLSLPYRHIRSRDHWATWLWQIFGAWTIAGGVWCTWALTLAAVRLPESGEPPHIALGWIALLAVACAAMVTSTRLVARQRWPRALRSCAQAAVFAGFWLLMTDFASRCIGVVPPAQPLRDPLLALSFASAALGGGATCWLLDGMARRDPRQSWILPLVAAAVLTVCGTAMQLAWFRSIGAALVRLPSMATTASPGAIDSTDLLSLVIEPAVLVVLATLAARRDTIARRSKSRQAVLSNQSNRQFKQLAHFDVLTRLPNRLMFEEKLVDALRDAQSNPQPCGLVVFFIDLDGFKPINDSFGHASGDAVLSEIGRRLKAVARAEDTVARVGGDEFLLMLTRPDGHVATSQIAERVLAAVGEPLRLPNDVMVNLSCSIGIATFPEHGPASKLIANADAAMYAAKRQGGSKVVFFEPKMEVDSRNQLELHRDLRDATAHGELRLYYQPKVDGRSGQITGVEALVRWQHPSRGLIAPGVFIPIAERCGLISAIGDWVIDEACRQMQEWSAQGLRMRVAVNLSVHQLRQGNLVRRIRSATERFGVDPRLLTFEITESVAMEDTQETMRCFEQFSAVGVALSIDDFGTGYSSLAYLRKLPAKQLKIDRSFVQDLDTSSDALAVVDAVIKLAHALGLGVVAEGVETERQRDILLSLKCDELQGFFFGRPMAPGHLLLWAMGESHFDRMAAAPDESAGPDCHCDFRPSLFTEVDGAGDPLPA